MTQNFGFFFGNFADIYMNERKCMGNCLSNLECDAFQTGLCKCEICDLPAKHFFRIPHRNWKGWLIPTCDDHSVEYANSKKYEEIRTAEIQVFRVMQS